MMRASASRLAVFSALLYCFATPARAATIVSVTGPNDANTQFTILSNNLAVGFTTTADYVNVSIDVSLASFLGGGDWNLQAYLMTQLGPGTTAVPHEWASASQSIAVSDSPLTPPYTFTDLTVFAGDLLAGTYYLVLSGTFGTGSAFWVSSPNGDLTTVTDTGVSVIEGNLSAGVADPYLPASVFTATPGSGFWFGVFGDPAPVPEPATISLIAGGLALVALGRRARKA